MWFFVWVMIIYMSVFLIYVRVSVDEVHVCPHQPYTDWMDGYLAWF